MNHLKVNLHSWFVKIVSCYCQVVWPSFLSHWQTDTSCQSPTITQDVLMASVCGSSFHMDHESFSFHWEHLCSRPNRHLILLWQLSIVTQFYQRPRNTLLKSLIHTKPVDSNTVNPQRRHVSEKLRERGFIHTCRIRKKCLFFNTSCYLSLTVYMKRRLKLR